jgi:hypothetical protein
LLRAEEFARVADVLSPSPSSRINRTLTLRAYGRGAPPALLHEQDIATADPHVPGFSCLVADFFAD